MTTIEYINVSYPIYSFKSCFPTTKQKKRVLGMSDGSAGQRQRRVASRERTFETLRGSVATTYSSFGPSSLVPLCPQEKERQDKAKRDALRSKEIAEVDAMVDGPEKEEAAATLASAKAANAVLDAAAAEKEAVRQEEAAEELEAAKEEDAEQAADEAARQQRYVCDDYTPCEAPELSKFRKNRIEAQDTWGNRGWCVEVPNMWGFRSALEWGDASGNGHSEWYSNGMLCIRANGPRTEYVCNFKVAAENVPSLLDGEITEALYNDHEEKDIHMISNDEIVVQDVALPDSGRFRRGDLTREGEYIGLLPIIDRGGPNYAPPITRDEFEAQEKAKAEAEIIAIAQAEAAAAAAEEARLTAELKAEEEAAAAKKAEEEAAKPEEAEEEEHPPAEEATEAGEEAIDPTAA